MHWKVTSGSVESVTITTAGSKYTFGTIDVALIPNIGNGVGASLDVVIPPNNGHGADAVREFVYRLMFTSKLETSSAFVDFPNDLTYRRAGLSLNPLITIQQLFVLKILDPLLKQ